ncbi:MAG TPA: 3-hydroxyacyl-CoA dehydrogenase NAD-binding domain-containing protein [Acidimicrobiales bacterium]|nr:3-hydroxyacyl-CoA dehydrogenase NAD-binding domain-containing protein [Acidimicrobiales bacterium]
MTTSDQPVVACIGMGVIGCGWAAHFLGQGYGVQVWDPVDGVEERLNSFLDLAWPAMANLGLPEGADRNNFVVCETAIDAVKGAVLVQESAPERLDLKVDLLSELDQACSNEVVIASSTSGYLVSDMTPKCAKAPERVLVGHPFNPVYLLPLVELVAGPETSQETLQKAQNIYESTGKIVLKLDKEVDGFVSDRLQEAMWREALHMVANGEATVEQLDLAITAGPGLRWALMGPMLTFHLAGGEGGMAHMLDHFGPSLKSPWTRLEAPELTKELRDAVVEGCETEAAGRSVATLVNERDKGLVAIIKALREAEAGTPGQGEQHGS